MLTDRHLEQYRREGYITLEGIYGPDEVAALREASDAFLERSREVSEHTEVFDLEPGHTAEAPRLRRIKDPVLHDERFRAALHHPALLDAVAPLLRGGVRFRNSKLNLKSGEFGSAVEWHQDWAFYPHTNDDVLAVGVCLDDMRVENGALSVLPRSHTGPVYDHHDPEAGWFVGAITDPAFAAEGAVPLEVPAGGITIHHVRAVHGSLPNRSDRPRRLLLFEFCAVDAWPLMGNLDWETYCSEILRGEPTLTPRMEALPVRISQPRAPRQGSIYELQTQASRRPLAGS